MTKTLIQRTIKKAGQSICNHKISALGIDAQGNFLAIGVNKKRLNHKGGGIHAEIDCIRKAGPRLRTIVLCRVNRSGEVLPIDPCEHCQKILDKKGLKIVTIQR